MIEAIIFAIAKKFPIYATSSVAGGLGCPDHAAAKSSSDPSNQLTSSRRPIPGMSCGPGPSPSPLLCHSAKFFQGLGIFGDVEYSASHNGYCARPGGGVVRSV